MLVYQRVILCFKFWEVFFSVTNIGHGNGRRISLQVRVRIPERPPTRSTNSFYLEMGFDPGIFNLDRMQAGMVMEIDVMDHRPGQ